MKAFSLLSFVTLATFSDTLFGMMGSKLVMSRQFNFLHVLATLIGFLGVICSEMLTYNGSNKYRFSSDCVTNVDKLLAYSCCIISRLSHILAALMNKKGLLQEAAFDRYRLFLMSVSFYFHLSLIV